MFINSDKIGRRKELKLKGSCVNGLLNVSNNKRPIIVLNKYATISKTSFYIYRVKIFRYSFPDFKENHHGGYKSQTLEFIQTQLKTKAV